MVQTVAKLEIIDEEGVAVVDAGAVLKNLQINSKDALRSLLVPGAVRALRCEAAKIGSVEEAVALAEKFSYLRIQIAPAQVRSEITGLLKLLAERPPKTALEIGAYKGGTFFLFSRVAAPDALLVNLDLPPWPAGMGHPLWRDKLFRSYARAQQRIELVRGDSHQPDLVAKVRQLLAGRQIDFLFIDGDHSYDSVKTDFEFYSPLVARDGLIAFHDIVPGSPDPRCEGPEFWREIKKTRNTLEFVADWKQGGYGIGAVKNSPT